MKVLSLFDGIACGRVAFERAGIPVEKYYASEIDKYAIQVTQKNYPDTIQVGDVTKLNYLELLDVDIVIGGSPCQDLSIAKQNREGLRGARSGLFWKYVEALEVIHPRYFLLENVASMKNEDRDAITSTLQGLYPDVECVMINSALVSAQQRKRYYWTNWHVGQPANRGIVLRDILETSAEYSGDCNMPVPEATKKGFTEIVPGDCVDLTQLSSKTRRGRSMKDKSNCLTASNPEYYQYMCPERIGCLPGLSKGQANRIYSVRGKSVCLQGSAGGSGAKTGLYKVNLPDGDYIIRKLTPLECERLQTLPDNYTAGISNSQRYKAIGNGWTVDAIAHILGGLK